MLNTFLVFVLLIENVLLGAEIFEPSGEPMFPTDIPSNTTVLKIVEGNFSSMDPTDLDGLPLLWKLEIRSTALTEFPDVRSVADTLTALHLVATKISIINSEYLGALSNLVTLEISDSPLLDFPEVFDLDSLLTLDLVSTFLTCVPNFSPYQMLESLTLRHNADMEFCTGNEFTFSSAPRLKRIHINQSPKITHLPSLEDIAESLEVLEVAAYGLTVMESFTLSPLKAITDLRLITSPSLKRLPPVCMEDLSTLTIVLSAMDLCKCENLWVKMLNSMDPGHTLWSPCNRWSTTSLEDLLLACGVVSTHYGKLYLYYIYNLLMVTPKLNYLLICIL